MPDEVVATPFGKFLIPKGDLIGETLRAGTCWDGPGFLQVIAQEYARLGHPGWTVIDVGANLGAFTIWLAAHGAWRVVAVEPVAQTRQYLKASLDLNQPTCADRVVVLEIAAYDQGGLLAVPTPDPGNLGGTALTPVVGPWSGDTCRVQGLTSVVAAPLDRYQWLWATGVSLIKIDAQGCDGRVIRGLVTTIHRWHPVIVFEWEADLASPHGMRLPDLLAQLAGWGYQVHEWPGQVNNYLAVWAALPGGDLGDVFASTEDR